MQPKESDLLSAIRFLKLALPEMSSRKIPTTPENYAVWYEYATGSNLELREAVKRLDRLDTLYDDEVNAELYQTFIESQSEASQINKLKTSIRKLIDELLSTVSDQGDGLLDFSNSLNTFSEKVDTLSNTGDIKELIKGLIIETQKQEQSTRALKASLTEMACEIRDMRSDLLRISEEVNTDDLTKLANRRMFDRELQAAISDSHRNGGVLSVVLLDIDYFKQFNDQYGHVIGDKVLRYVSSTLEDSVRGRDLVARIGGEEFGVILPDTAYQGALAVADNLRSRIAAQKLTDGKAKIRIGSITVSAGVSSIKPNDSMEDIYRRADQCLYLSKHQGRNTVTGEQALSENQQYPTFT